MCWKILVLLSSVIFRDTLFSSSQVVMCKQVDGQTWQSEYAHFCSFLLQVGQKDILLHLHYFFKP
jgi:hypothetical protein